jgi:hypothetical protein
MEDEALEGAARFITFHPNLTIIFEEKHTGKDAILKILEDLAVFEYGIVDEYNLYAKKIN